MSFALVSSLAACGGLIERQCSDCLDRFGNFILRKLPNARFPAGRTGAQKPLAPGRSPAAGRVVEPGRGTCKFLVSVRHEAPLRHRLRAIGTSSTDSNSSDCGPCSSPDVQGSGSVPADAYGTSSPEFHDSEIPYDGAYSKTAHATRSRRRAISDSPRLALFFAVGSSMSCLSS